MIFKAIVDKIKKSSNNHDYINHECKLIIAQTEGELEYKVMSILHQKGEYDEIVLRDIFNISEPTTTQNF